MKNVSTLAPPNNSADGAPSCASCDTASSAGAKFCPQCGRDLTTPTPPMAVGQQGCAETESSPSEGAGSSQDASVESLQPPKCACSCPLPDDASYCPGCGVALGVEPVSGFWLTRVGSQGK